MYYVLRELHSKRRGVYTGRSMDDGGGFLCECQRWQETAGRQEGRQWGWPGRSIELELTGQSEATALPPPLTSRRVIVVFACAVIWDATAARLLLPPPPSLHGVSKRALQKPLPKIIITVPPFGQSARSGRQVCVPSPSFIQTWKDGNILGGDGGEATEKQLVRSLNIIMRPSIWAIHTLTLER